MRGEWRMEVVDELLTLNSYHSQQYGVQFWVLLGLEMLRCALHD